MTCKNMHVISIHIPWEYWSIRPRTIIVFYWASRKAITSVPVRFSVCLIVTVLYIYQACTKHSTWYHASTEFERLYNWLFASLNSLVNWILNVLYAGKCALILEVQEPNASYSIFQLGTTGSQSCPIGFVVGHTYHITCRNTAHSQKFDNPARNAWYHGTDPIQTLSSSQAENVSASGESRTYASTGIRQIANGWTLVLQVFGGGGTAEGMYSCLGLRGESRSLYIQQSKDQK